MKDWFDDNVELICWVLCISITLSMFALLGVSEQHQRNHEKILEKQIGRYQLDSAFRAGKNHLD